MRWLKRMSGRIRQRDWLMDSLAHWRTWRAACTKSRKILRLTLRWQERNSSSSLRHLVKQLESEINRGIQTSRLSQCKKVASQKASSKRILLAPVLDRWSLTRNKSPLILGRLVGVIKSCSSRAMWSQRDLQPLPKKVTSFPESKPCPLRSTIRTTLWLRNKWRLPMTCMPKCFNQWRTSILRASPMSLSLFELTFLACYYWAKDKELKDKS